LFDSCTLPLTSARRIDMLVSEMAVTVFPEGKATPLETGPDVLTVEQVVAATEAKLVLPANIPQMQV
jgi:acetate CoA/acetoacetate CoA-transferase beta subunit